jgi:hypothetical protein
MSVYGLPARTKGAIMTRSLVLLGAAALAVAWLVSQSAFANDTPHKQVGALIAITVPFLALDIALSIRKRRRRHPPRPRASIRAKLGTWRW